MNIPLWSFPCGRQPASCRVDGRREEKRGQSPAEQSQKSPPSPDGKREIGAAKYCCVRKSRLSKPPCPRRNRRQRSQRQPNRQATAMPPRLGESLRLPAAVSALRAVLLIRSSLVGEATDNFFNVRTVGDGLVLAESQLRRNAQIERLCQLPADIA